MDHITTRDKVSLSSWPTPLDSLANLSAVIGGPRLLIKRDDVTTLGGGGNKVRKLEYLLADAVAHGADTVITPGAFQSNHARLTAAAASRFGLRCILVLTDSVAHRDEAYRRVGNFQLYRILGADIRIVPGDQESGPVMEQIAAEEQNNGRRPYVIPLGGSNEIGSRGYFDAFKELMTQLDATSQGPLDAIVLATGSGGTQAGLLASAIASGWQGSIIGISVGAPKVQQQEKVARILQGLLASGEFLSRIEVDDRFVGDGYGQPTAQMLSAVRTIARREGIFLDPVYTGKAMAGLLRLIAEGRFGRGQTVVFWHTGGTPALSAYWDAFAQTDEERIQ